MKKLVLFFFLSLSICNSQYAEIRYVSHSGSSTPPYISWETAADSIMSAINISSFGDTIYVANGVYEEQVVMIPGLSLIGAGMDSCIINAANITSFSLSIRDSCLVEGFKIISALYNWCISDPGCIGSRIMFNELQNMANFGGGISVNNLDTSINSNIFIYKNLFRNVIIGIDIFNSNAEIRKNLIYPFPNSQSSIVNGVRVGGYFLNFSPVIDSNYIEVNMRGAGINKSYGSRFTVKNNLIKLNQGGKGISIGYTDSSIVCNNLIIGNPGGGGITDGFGQQIYNNVVFNVSGTAYEISGVVKNNIAINCGTGFVKYGTPTIQYNNSWHNGVNYPGFTPDSTNISVDPMVVNEDTSNGGPDFHLQMFSPLIDRGDPAILDVDGTRSDIGLYGGTYGESYKYQDLPPRSPVNLSATIDTNYILLKWNKNTVADFNHYNLFRDTTENFTVDSTTFAASVEDTFYIHIRPEGINNLYFKLTAVDNQGNVSDPSEELHLVLTGVKDKEEFIINNYRLFQNYPNPFNPTTRIGYRLKERGYVKLYIYDIKGELVQTLVNQSQEGGYHEVEYTGNATEGSSSLANQLASGIYICQIMVSNEHNIPVFTDIIKMVYLK